RHFGLMRKSYLKNHRRDIYSGLLLSGELEKHLLLTQEQAGKRFDLLRKLYYVNCFVICLILFQSWNII
ncbi:MAG: TnpV protein, partial [Lachnospiraceae bacterium]|nr:TnpV protein [Lachnospiraceae bacterium]